jgi:ribose transport system substrate-binding protein
LLTACGKAETPAANAPAPGGKKINLVYITKGQTDVFWLSVKSGLRQAESEAKAKGQNVVVTWDAPLKDGDSPSEISLMENYIGQKPDGIILCPVDFKALVTPVEKAHAAGIPVIIADSGLDSKIPFAFVGTNNFKGGQTAGEELARLLGGKGNVILLRFLQGTASCTEREEGFLDAIKKYPGIKVLSSDNYAGATRDLAFDKSLNLLNSFTGQVDGVFTPNEGSTNGMLLALQKAGLAGKVKFIGFDGGTANMEGLKAGQINGLVLQNPYMMGYLGVNTMLDHLAGKDVPANVDTGSTLVTKENLDSGPVKELLAHTVQ